MEFDGKIALVTGAGRESGLGFATARRLAVEGATVLLTARDGAAAQALAARLGERVTGYALDVTDQGASAALADEVKARFGRLDILVNNAALTSVWGETAATADMTAARAALEVILLGSWSVTQAFLPLLRQSGSPRVVMVSSGAGSHADPAFGLTTPNAMGPSYAVAKAALNALTGRLALEETGPIRINAVCPGFTATFPGGAEMGARPVDNGVDSILWAARLGNDGPTGQLFRDGSPLPW